MGGWRGRLGAPLEITEVLPESRDPPA